MLVTIIKDILLVFTALFVFILLATFMIGLVWHGVPYVPSKKKIIQKCLEVANLQPGQKVYDLGCGDGRFLIQAEKKQQINGIGYEIAPLPFMIACFYRFITGSKIKLKFKNFLKVSLADADIIFCYLGPEATQQAAQKAFQECKKGTKFISNTFAVKNKQPSATFFPHIKTQPLYLYEI